MSDFRLKAAQNGSGAHVLVTSASRKVPLIRAMKEAAARISPGVAVIAGDTDPNVTARYAADAFWHMPRLDESSPAALLAACLERGIGTILPTRDGELMFWSRAKEEFASAGINIIVSSPQSVNCCLDKLKFTQFGYEHELPVIPASVDPDDLETGSYVVKERFGSGSRGVGLDLRKDAACAHAEILESPIFQPFISGTEISVDAWMDENTEPRGLILRRRDLVVGGESRITTTFRDSRLESTALLVLGELKLRGPAVLQAIVPKTGELFVIECNARFGGASTASIAAGLDMLYWSLVEHHSTGTSPQFERIPGELRQVRVSGDIVLHDPDF